MTIPYIKTVEYLVGQGYKYCVHAAFDYALRHCYHADLLVELQLAALPGDTVSYTPPYLQCYHYTHSIELRVSFAIIDGAMLL